MKFYAVMLGFNRTDVIEEAMQNFVRTTDNEPYIEKWFFEVGYPLPNPQENEKTNRANCEKYGWKHNKIDNKGVMSNWNQVIHEFLHMQNGDFLCTYDPDVRMDKKGWVPAMIEALQSDESAMFCSSALDFHHHDWMQKTPYYRTVSTLPSGLRVSRFKTLIAWASGTWKADFLITRPRDFAQKGAFYGWSEHADYERLLKNGKTWLSVTDFVDYHLGARDPEYTEWKKYAASNPKHIDFESWLRSIGKIS